MMSYQSNLNSESLSQNYFGFLYLNSLLEEIEYLRASLSCSHFVQYDAVFVSPDQCDVLVDILSKSIVEIEAFQSLSKQIEIPNQISHKFLMYLYSASEKAGKLILQISYFKSIGMDRTRPQFDLFEKINRNMIYLIEACEQIKRVTEQLW
jgi:hypothetical protein